MWLLLPSHVPARRYRHQDGDALLLQLKAGHNAARARLASMVHRAAEETFQYAVSRPNPSKGGSK